MGGNEGFLTPKAIAKRIKAKGLGKLKFYCQMCEKQCRDANGFKCHCQSESHRRQMELVSQQPGRFTTNFSQNFEAGFMDLVRTRYRTQNVRANQVYNEYIQDRDHVHMNSTRWTTLTEFVMHLGREGKVEAEDTSKGWFIRYIDQEEIARKEEQMRKQKAVVDHETRMLRDIEKQKVRAAEMADGIVKEVESTPLHRSADAGKIAISLGAPSLAKEPQDKKPKTTLALFEEEDDPVPVKQQQNQQEKLPASSSSTVGTKRGRTRDTESASQPTPPKKAKKTVLNHWLHEGIVVKVILKKLAEGKFYKQKGVVLAVKDKYGARVKMIQSGETLLLDQEHVETVIPAPGGSVLVVNGAHRGQQGTLQTIHEDKFAATLLLENGQSVEIPYEHFSKRV